MDSIEVYCRIDFSKVYFMGSNSDLARLLGSMPSADTPERRGELALRVADLFELQAGTYNDDQLYLFDSIFSLLLDRIEVAARIELAKRFGKKQHAPAGLIESLACDKNIEVAGPVLLFSPCLTESALVACATGSAQGHLLAISRRRALTAPVTDILIHRGDSAVLRSVAMNADAQVSEMGYSMIINRLEGDDALANLIGMRPDLPRHLFIRLVAAASSAVRDRLLTTSPHTAAEIRSVVSDISPVASAEIQKDYSKARENVEAIRNIGRLNDAAMREFARQGKLDESIVALSILCELPVSAIEAALKQDRPEGIIVMARAIGLSWHTTRAILSLKGASRWRSPRRLEQAANTFQRLKADTAIKALLLHRMRFRTAAA